MWSYTGFKKDPLDSEDDAPATLEVQQNTSTARGDETQVSSGDLAGMFDPAATIDTSKDYAGATGSYGTSTDADISYGYTDPATSIKWGDLDLGKLKGESTWGAGALPVDETQQSVTADITQTYVDPATGETWGDDLGPALEQFRDDVGAANGVGQSFDPYAGDIGGMVEQWIADQFGGVRDTSADEQLISDQQARMMGGSLADNAARMGRAGFAASGANAAIGGDIRREAAMQAAREMLDVRERARQEELARASAAMGGHFRMSSLASEDARREAMLSLLQEMMDDGEAQGAAGPSGGVTSADLADFTNDQGSQDGLFGVIGADSNDAKAYIASTGIAQAEGPDVAIAQGYRQLPAGVESGLPPPPEGYQLWWNENGEIILVDTRTWRFGG
ncbi:MAG: hypothetical protein VW405_18885 [Rhodospirillaceae bacterium]